MAKDKKEKKPATRGSAIRLTTILTIVAVICLALLIVVPILANYYEPVLRDFLGEAGGSGGNTDFDYYEVEYDSYDELEAVEKQYVRDAAGEAYVLLKNEDDTLPLKTSKSNPTEVALFSQSSVDFVVGGSGSGESTSDVTLKEAFEDVGYIVNEDLWNFYSKTSKHGRGEGASFSGSGGWDIDEAPISELQSRVSRFNAISNTATAIFIMSRIGGEGADEPRYMGDSATSTEDKARSYLEPDSVELDVISYLNAYYSEVILVLNTNNVMETGWIDDYENVKAVLWAPGGGDQAAYALADVISGNTTPSGHLVDTMAYSDFSSPAMQNMGDFAYTNGSGSNNQTGYFGVSYDEGIYVGYKYYETRYYDSVMGQGYATGSAGVYCSSGNSWNYAEEVAYPFGYGESYTDFTWSNFSVKENGDDTFTVSVNVKNTGDVAGKDVVEVYLNAPYTDYDKENHVEKSAVTLVGFAKTALLEPGEDQTMEIVVDRSDFASYDDVGYQTYVLEGGDYLLTVATDAHEAANNFLAYEKKTVSDGMTSAGSASFVYSYNQVSDDATTYATSKAGAEVTNRFEIEAASTATEITSNCNFIDREKYLTRQDWQGSWPVSEGNQDRENSSEFDEVNGYQYETSISNTLLAKLEENGTAAAANNPVDDGSITSEMAGSYGVSGDMELIDMRGMDYDDDSWDALISQMTASEVGLIVNRSGYCTPLASSIQKPETQDRDGPAQLQNMVNGTMYNIAYLSDVAVGATWNTNVAYLHGHYISQDGLILNAANGWYGPAMNIHRTPFAGRNFEYYSEDGFISGSMAKSAVIGAAENGMYACIKHYALNDQETHRADEGVATWCNEQAMREIYLKPFQMVSEAGTVTEKYFVKTLAVDESGMPILDDDGNETYENVPVYTEIPAMQGLMTSFNRVGATWAGGSYQLVQEILRDEWGFNGFVVTDYSQGSDGFMHTTQMLRAGGDAQLSQFGNSYSIGSDAEIYYTKEAMHHILYTVVNSNAMDTGRMTQPFAYYVIVEIIFEVVFAAGIVLCVAFTVHRWMRYRKDKNGSDNGGSDAPDENDTPDTLNL